MRERDRTRLRHMLDAAQEARNFVEGRDRSALDEDRVLTLAVVRLIEIIGEAASQVSDETRSAHPEVPWADIVGMRNRLIHAYFDVDHDRVWDTIQQDLPPLVGQIEEVLREPN